MDAQLQQALTLRQTDLQGVLNRFYNDEDMYIACLKAFLEDPTVAELNAAISQQAWDDAFTAAHALKGVAGNMGFVPLMHATGQLVILIRGGRIKELSTGLEQVNSYYRDITDAIQMGFEAMGEEETK